MNGIILKLLGKNKTVGDALNLREYRRAREAAYRLYEVEKEAAKKELDTSIALPMALYRGRVDKVYEEYRRYEQEIWNVYQEQLNDKRIN